MIDTLSAPGSDALFGTSGGYVLWYMPSRRRTGWEAVATAATESEAVAQIGVGGRHNGQWLILPAGKQP